jgi:CRP-like cAMP-binding protein
MAESFLSSRLPHGRTAINRPYTDLQPFINRLTVRSVLTDEEQHGILALPTHPIRLSAKQDFVHINEVSTYCCFIASGMVGRFGQTREGARQTTAFHIPGDMVDLHSAVRPVGIGGLNALCETIILRVPHTEIRALAARFPAVAEAFWRDCMLDAAVLMQWVVNIGRRDARTRLAHILCEMAIRSGEDREILCDYALPVTQEQLADAAGLTSVHVNRSLKALSDVVSLKGGRAQIHDWAALAELGEFDATYLTSDTTQERRTRLPYAT